MRGRKRHVDGTALREKRLAEDYEVEDEEKGVRGGRERWEREAAIYENAYVHIYYIARLQGIDCSLRGKSAGNDEE